MNESSSAGSMIYGSVCSGIEAVTVAWRPLGFRPAWFAEIDPFCSALLAHHYPDVPNLGDFSEIQASTGAIEILVGGVPCQSFSIAGKRRGLDDPRGNLAIEFCRLAGRLRPRWIVLENVPGLLSSHGGRDFGTILGALADVGYGCAWRVLDAQFFGVPQRRRRVFVVGHLGDWRRAAAVLLEREGLCRNTPARRKARSETAGTLEARASTGGFDPGAHGAASGHLIATFGGNNTSGPIDVATACNAHGGSMRMDFETETFCVEVAHTLRGEGMDASEDGTGRGVPILPVGFSCKDGGTDALEDIAPTMRAMGHRGSHPNAGGQLAVAFRGFGQDGFAPSEIAPPVLASDGGSVGPPVVFESRFVRNGRGGPGKVAPPLKAQSGGSGRGDGAPLLATRVAVRRLTARECERLQGLPDDYTLIPNYRRKLRTDEIEEMAAYLGIAPEEARRLGATPDGPRYKAIGNSMAVPVMRWIGRRIQFVDGIRA
jgi:DNA (cytosine-5)-methyltransferase 1